jgi:hypothetical protein
MWVSLPQASTLHQRLSRPRGARIQRVSNQTGTDANHGQTTLSSASPPRGGSGLGLASPHAATGLLCFGLIGVGWVFRDELDLSAAEGVGYALGILGLSSMTLLLGYSIRKRIKALRGVGSMRTWFEVHLVLGLIGPTMILYHAGFKLTSMNSTISLACVLAVSGSGIGGRYLYGRMHRSLAGSRRSVESLYSQGSKALQPLAPALEQVPAAANQLRSFGQFARTDAFLPILMIRVSTLRPRAWVAKRSVLGAIRARNRTRPVPESVRVAIGQYFSAHCRGLELRLFEKLFALWHAIHVPLTIILFISAAIHVLAVHLY